MSERPFVDELTTCIRHLYECHMKQLNTLGQAKSVREQMEGGAQEPVLAQKLAELYLQSFMLSSQTLSLSSNMSDRLIAVAAGDRSPRKRSRTSRNSSGQISSPSASTIYDQSPLLSAAVSPNQIRDSGTSRLTLSSKGKTRRALRQDIWSTHSRVLPVGHLVAALVDEYSEPNLWILASVTQYIPTRRRYMVLDEDTGDEANAANRNKVYTLSADKIIALPRPDEVPISERPEFLYNERVLAIYPKTTVFYPARVEKTPKKTKSSKYVLVFNDDGDAFREVEAHHIVPFPNRTN